MKAAEFQDFTQLHIIEDFESQAAVRARGFIGSSPRHLKCADAHVGSGMWIAYAMRLDDQIEGHAEKGDQHLFPKADHFHADKQREVIQFQQPYQGSAPAQCVWAKTNIRIGEQKPISGGDFVRSMQRLWLAKPARGQFPDVHHFKAWMIDSKLVEDAGSRVLRTIIDGND